MEVCEEVDEDEEEGEWEQQSGGDGRRVSSSYDYPDPDEAGADDATPKETAPCDICGRSFATDRLARHVKICKSSGKKRKVFGASAERLKKQERAAEEEAKHKEEKAAKKATWKAQHEAFQNALKSAAAIKNGEPPPADLVEVEDTRTPCPHCGRKFEKMVAERHIPSCAKAIKRPNPVGGERKRPGKSSPASGEGEHRVSKVEKAPSADSKPPQSATPSGTPVKVRPPSAASSPSKAAKPAAASPAKAAPAKAAAGGSSPAKAAKNGKAQPPQAPVKRAGVQRAK